uniref:Small ribosomal subunit protein uS3c n=1 Tax=Pyramimonas parkeae TaxID=36894 RepID=A0A1D8I1S6_9CHLO|nr:ribosomal protein S3 [Pyramimonas parkeae]AOT98934.1 ribosomal protein S3 [Pyramimonas parkeae]
MGQKVNPISLRLGINRQHDSIWFGDFHYPQLLGKELITRDSISKISENADLATSRIVTKIFPQKIKIFPFWGIKKNQVNPGLSKSSIEDKETRIFLSNLIDLTMKNSKNLPPRNISKKNKISNLKVSIKSFSNFRIWSPKKIKFSRNEKADLAEIKRHLQKKLQKYLSVHLDELGTSEQELKGSFFEFTKKLSSKIFLIWIFENFFISSSQKGCEFEESFRLLIKYKMLRRIINFSHTFNWIKKRKTLLVQRSLEHLESSFSQSFKNPVQILPLIIKNPYKSADLLAKKIAVELEKTRVYRKVLKTICNEAESQGFIRGIRISCSGRLGGVELAENEFKKMGPTSLQEFSEEIDYACSESITKFGVIGVKVWLCFFKNDIKENRNVASTKTNEIS